MLIERLTFSAKYGKGDALLDAIREFQRLFGAQVGVPSRVVTDRTGKMFTVAWDMEYADLQAWAAAMTTERAMFGTPEFAKWFASMEPLIESGDRQLLDVVEL
ncbi:MAG TPA: hypothetical protein VJQ83_02700 [Tepidiformaceae bacterium]|nr:hypothetical protein [Tepidiformaceae bacterium]